MPEVLSRPETKADERNLVLLEIVQAFSYHEFLSFPDGSDSSEDGHSEGDEQPEGEEGLKDDADNEDGDDDDDDDSDLNSDSGEPTIVLTKVGFEDVLLYSTTPVRSTTRHASRPRTGCPNSIFRDEMWMDDPELHLMDSGMGFLSQLAQLCIQAKIRRCYNKDCLEWKKQLSIAAPHCKWPALRTGPSCPCPAKPP